MLPVAYVTIPQFAIQLELQRRGEQPPPGTPIVLVTPVEEGARVFARSPEAGRRGVITGQPLRLALTRCNEAVFWTADVPYYQERFTAMLDALEAVSPLVAADEASPGCAWIGLRGLERLFGDEAAVAMAIDRCCRKGLGLRPRIGIAAGKFQARLAALAVALRGAPPVHAAAAVLPASRQRSNPRPGQAAPSEEPLAFILDARRGPAFLARLGIGVLPLSSENQRRLRLLGLHTVAQLAGLSRAHLQLQCGAEGAHAWDLATGQDDDRLAGRRPRQIVKDRACFPVATASLDLVLAAVRHVLTRLFRRGDLRGRAIRRIIVRAALTTGTFWERPVVFREPLQDPREIFWILKARLEAVTLPAAVEEIELELGEITGEPARQARLLLEQPRAAGTGPVSAQVSSQAGARATLRRQLEATISQLNTRTGEPLVTRIVPVEPWSRIPERRFALVEYGQAV